MAREEPVRTCIGCRSRAPKRELIRVAQTPDGGIRLDHAGSAPGRGAYVHPRPACAVAAGSDRRLVRALRASAGLDEAARLLAEIGRIVRAT
jgi:uncharacterized protein